MASVKKILALSAVAIFAGAVPFIKPSLRLVAPKGWPAPAYDLRANPLSPSRVLLGRALFYDPALSADSTVSCSSCHLQYTAFSHVDHALSHGIGDSVGTRNAPPLTNLAWQQAFMWDGAVNHLDVQPLAPITHRAEMGESLPHVVTKLRRSQLYRRLFYAAFNDSVATGQRMLKSLAQFMLSLNSWNSKYDSVMAGTARFTERESRGYGIFRVSCSSCHQEPLFTNGKFENNGLAYDAKLADTGRMRVTGNRSDSLRFKVPTLRNVEFSYPYMHDGRLQSLGEVLRHYSGALPSINGSCRELTAMQRADLTAFLLTLTDRNFLFDTALSYPRFLFAKK